MQPIPICLQLQTIFINYNATSNYVVITNNFLSREHGIAKTRIRMCESSINFEKPHGAIKRLRPQLFLALYERKVQRQCALLAARQCQEHNRERENKGEHSKYLRCQLID